MCKITSLTGEERRVALPEDIVRARSSWKFKLNHSNLFGYLFCQKITQKTQNQNSNVFGSSNQKKSLTGEKSRVSLPEDIVHDLLAGRLLVRVSLELPHRVVLHDLAHELSGLSCAGIGAKSSFNRQGVCADFGTKFSTFFRKQKIPEIYFLVNSSKTLKGGGTLNIGPFHWELFEKLIKDWTWVLKFGHFPQFLNFFKYIEILRIWDFGSE